MKRLEVKLAGFGGQGIILAGQIIGQAAVLFDQKNAVLTQSYGPESRGGACSADLIISEEEILHPLVIKPQVMVVMSQEAYDRYASEVAPGGMLLVDADLVPIPARRSKKRQIFPIPATRVAEEVGRRIVANIVMLGSFIALTGAISVEAMKRSILSLVPKGTEDLNLRAFEQGYEYGKRLAADRSVWIDSKGEAAGRA
jgi:2-oxoglutarate ferredoxin oxidoreductase subunit gamma